MVELRSYFHSAVEQVPEVVFWTLLAIFGIGMTALVWSRGLREGLRMSSVLLLLEWVFVILGITLFFREERLERAVNLIPLNSYYHYAKNTYPMEVAAINILNVVMFFPLGLLLGLGFRKMTWRKVFLLCLVGSVLIEILQLIFMRGLCEVDDIIHNVVGCMMGYFTVRLLDYIHALHDMMLNGSRRVANLHT